MLTIIAANNNCFNQPGINFFRSNKTFYSPDPINPSFSPTYLILVSFVLSNIITIYTNILYSVLFVY